VLHTWTQQLHLHPHVHCLVTGGGLSDAGRRWHPAEKNFLFPTKALGKLVRTRFRDAFSKLRLDISLPPHTWRTPWVVHITPWSEGKAVLDYFAGYALRIAVTDRRIVRVNEAGVTLRCQDRAANCPRTATLPAPSNRNADRRPPGVSIHGRTTAHSTPCRPLFRSSPSPKRQSRA